MPATVIEWDHERLIVARGAIDGSRVAFDALRILERSPEAPVDNELLAGIRNTLPASSGKQRPKATLVFPRQSFTTYRIQLPRVPDDEIPDMVQMQAAMRLTVPVDQVCLDYAPLPAAADSETRDVLLVTVPREHVDTAREVLETCNLEIDEIRVSAFCAATAAVRAGIIGPESDPTAVTVLVLLRKDFIEVTFVRGTSVVFSHSGASWSSPDEIERSVRAELARARMSASESLSEHRIRRIVLIGNPNITSAISEQITQRLDNAPLERVDPAEAFISTPIPEGASAAAMVNVAGAIAAKTDHTVAAVDLLNPRRPPEEADLRRIRVLAGVLAAVVLFAAAFFWRNSRLTAAESLLSSVNASVRELQNTIDDAEDEQTRAAAVREWLDHDINWLDEIDRLRTIIGGTEQIYLRELTFSIRQGDDLASIRINGYARSRGDIELLGRRLTDAGYKVTPFDYQTTGREGYPVSLTMDVMIPVEPVATNDPSDSAAD